METKLMIDTKYKSMNVIYIICSIIGAAGFIIIYGFSTLDVTYDSWIFNGYIEKDIVQHYAGWMFYRNSPWKFPLGLAQNVFFPIGSVITFTDSIPLVSILLKSFSFILPETFQFFGWYVFICFILQGLSSSMLVSIFTKDKLTIILSSILFIFSPIMIERSFRHCALASHFLIIFSLYFLFKSKKENYESINWKYIILNILAVTIHPYFVPMVMGILFANLLGYIIYNKKFLVPVTHFMINIISILISGYIIGLFSVSGGAGGFGYYSMNINAIFNPLSIGVNSWSVIIKKYSQILGNYDGFNYLGFGVLFFILFLFINYVVKLRCNNYRLNKIYRIVANNIEVVLICIVFYLFAISNVITFGSRILLEYPLPTTILNICSIFRASSRMFYPVFYIIFLVVVLLIIKNFSKQTCNILLTILLIMQILDISPALIQKNNYFNSGIIEYPDYFKSESWNYVGKNYDTLFFLESDTVYERYDLAAFIAKNNMKSNITISNREPSGEIENNCQKYIENIRNGFVDDNNTAYITGDDLLFDDLYKDLNFDLFDVQDLGHYKIIMPKK